MNTTRANSSKSKGDKRDRSDESEGQRTPDSKKRKVFGDTDQDQIVKIDKIVFKRINKLGDKLIEANENDFEKIKSGFKNASVMSENIQKTSTATYKALQEMDQKIDRTLERIDEMDRRDQHQMRTLYEDIAYTKKTLEEIKASVLEVGTKVKNSVSTVVFVPFSIITNCLLQYLRRPCLICEEEGHRSEECTTYTTASSGGAAMLKADKCVTCGDKACVTASTPCKRAREPCKKCPRNSLNKFHIKVTITILVIMHTRVTLKTC